MSKSKEFKAQHIDLIIEEYILEEYISFAKKHKKPTPIFSVDRLDLKYTLRRYMEQKYVIDPMIAETIKARLKQGEEFQLILESLFGV
jgi:hypothetical protein